MKKDGHEKDHRDSEHAPLFEVECGSGSRYGAQDECYPNLRDQSTLGVISRHDRWKLVR